MCGFLAIWSTGPLNPCVVQEAAVLFFSVQGATVFSLTWPHSLLSLCSGDRPESYHYSAQLTEEQTEAREVT